MQPVLGRKWPPSGRNRALWGERRRDAEWPRPFISPRKISTGGFCDRLVRDQLDTVSSDEANNMRDGTPFKS